LVEPLSRGSAIDQAKHVRAIARNRVSRGRLRAFIGALNAFTDVGSQAESISARELLA
jgi:hypothetical protein